jgi:hypothetical protein
MPAESNARVHHAYRFSSPQPEGTEVRMALVQTSAGVQTP